MPASSLAIIKIMANLISAEETLPTEARKSALPSPADFPPSPSEETDAFWNFSTIFGMVMLVALWAVKLYTTWGAWGNLTIDSGHELYVPAMLAQGKQLYRDLWFPFGPGAPYFTSYLFRIFGARLNVLYWAGSVSALGSAIFLFLTGKRLSYSLAGWTAGAVVLLEAFQPSLFCFPLPYSSAAVYGCFTACVFLWMIVNACYSGERVWLLRSASAAAIAFLLKPEFGLASYACLSLLIAFRFLSQKSWKNFGSDILVVLPGVAVCGLVIGWMVSISGARFITQENIQSWPTSYFLKAYGKTWLETTGFTVSGSAFVAAFHRVLPVAALALALFFLFKWKGTDKKSLLGKAGIVLALLWYFDHMNFFALSLKQSLTLLSSLIFFPRDMVLYVILGAAAAWCYFVFKHFSARNFAVPIVFTFSSLIAFRVLMKMNTLGYPIYYNGPVILCYLMLFCMLIPRDKRSRQFVLLGEAALCLACLAPVIVHTKAIEAGARDFVPLTTDYGTIRVSSHMAESYKTALQFMKEKADLGKTVLSVPEDTSLYFLSGTVCPTRIFLFIPGAVAPGKMTEETIQQIERKPVDYLLWSNRTFVEYGAKEFGKDFNPELGDYLTSHYRPIYPLVTSDKPEQADKQWTAMVWERKPDVK
jgi:hypothetical protein